ncbi:MAG: hypothetical protein KJO44_02335 [Gemmatimonadetes bacterium]|nr:hypothetical protein [Gemmatimonadota bacterium]MBT8477375.1 hypothetical protein [Gemmatimonadota bacterium]
MKNERVHRWLTLGANFGVLIGIALLLVELNQNATMIRAQTRNELSTGIVDLFGIVAENQQLASLRRRADAGDELTEDEAYQYAIITRAFFRYWENVHYQYRQDLYDDVEFARQREAWKSYAATSEALVRFWCEHGEEFSPEFASEFDSVLTTHTC